LLASAIATAVVLLKVVTVVVAHVALTVLVGKLVFHGVCRFVFDGTPVRGASLRGERGSHGASSTGTGSHELPNLRPRNGGEILRGAIILYKVTSV
jgi:hypothetical protein